MVDVFESAYHVENLAEPLRSFVRYAILYGQKTGNNVSLTSGLRSVEAQIVLRRQNCGPTHYDIYERPASQCKPATARPGSSKHQKGEAADLDGAKNWTAKLLEPFNVKRTVPSEDWHFEWKGTNLSNDLAQLRKRMESQGFTDAEILTVLGPNLSVIDMSGKIDWTPGFDLPDVDLPDLPGLPSLPGSPSLPGVDSIPGIGVLKDLAGIWAKLSDPAFWARLGYGALGVTIILIGVAFLMRRNIETALEAIPV